MLETNEAPRQVRGGIHFSNIWKEKLYWTKGSLSTYSSNQKSNTACTVGNTWLHVKDKCWLELRNPITELPSRPFSYSLRNACTDPPRCPTSFLFKKSGKKSNALVEKSVCLKTQAWVLFGCKHYDTKVVSFSIRGWCNFHVSCVISSSSLTMKCCSWKQWVHWRFIVNPPYAKQSTPCHMTKKRNERSPSSGGVCIAQRE